MKTAAWGRREAGNDSSRRLAWDQLRESNSVSPEPARSAPSWQHARRRIALGDGVERRTVLRHQGPWLAGLAIAKIVVHRTAAPMPHARLTNSSFCVASGDDVVEGLVRRLTDRAGETVFPASVPKAWPIRIVARGPQRGGELGFAAGSTIRRSGTGCGRNRPRVRPRTSGEARRDRAKFHEARSRMRCRRGLARQARWHFSIRNASRTRLRENAALNRDLMLSGKHRSDRVHAGDDRDPSSRANCVCEGRPRGASAMSIHPRYAVSHASIRHSHRCAHVATAMTHRTKNSTCPTIPSW